MSQPVIPIASPVTSLTSHKHCEVCGTNMALDGRVCSPECQAKAIEAWRIRRRSMLMMLGAVALLLLFSTYGGRLFGA